MFADVSIGAISLIFGLSRFLFQYFVPVRIEGPGETARKSRLTYWPSLPVNVVGSKIL